MQSLRLEFYQRIYLWNLVGGHTAPSLKEAAVFLRIIEKLRLSDAEQRESEFTNNGAQYVWKPVSPEYGCKTVELETDEAKALAAAIETSPLRVNDAVWLDPIVTWCRNGISMSGKEVYDTNSGRNSHCSP
jgi:hypothetical protein